MATPLPATARRTPTPLHPLLPDRDEPAGVVASPAGKLDRQLPSSPLVASPGGSSAQAPGRPPQSAGSAGETRPVILHTVIKEDTLEGIALRYGIEVSALRSVNGLWPHESVRSAGRKHLYIPVGLCTHLCGTEALDAGGNPGTVIRRRSLGSPLAESPSRDPQRPYGSVAEAGIALYEELDSRERMAAPPFRRASLRSSRKLRSPESSAAPSQRSSFDQDARAAGKTSTPPSLQAAAADCSVLVPVQVVPQRQLSYFPGRPAKSRDDNPPVQEPEQPPPPSQRPQYRPLTPAAPGQRPAWTLLSRVASVVSRRRSEDSARTVQDGTVELQNMSTP